jgi:transposase
VAIVESGESAREAARLLDLGASTAIRWIARWTTTGSVAAKPGTGHTRRRWSGTSSGLLISSVPSLT